MKKIQITSGGDFFDSHCTFNWMIAIDMFTTRPILPLCHHSLRLSFAQVPARCVLQFQCIAELHVLNDTVTA